MGSRCYVKYKGKPVNKDGSAQGCLMFVRNFRGRKDISYLKIGSSLPENTVAAIKNAALSVDEIDRYLKLLRESSLARFIPTRTSGKTIYAIVPPHADWRETLIRVSTIRYVWENPSQVRNILKWHEEKGESPDVAFFLGHCVDASNIKKDGFSGETGAGHSIIYPYYLKRDAFKIFYNLVNSIQLDKNRMTYDPNFGQGVSGETRRNASLEESTYLPKTLPKIKEYLGIE